MKLLVCLLPVILAASFTPQKEDKREAVDSKGEAADSKEEGANLENYDPAKNQDAIAISLTDAHRPVVLLQKGDLEAAPTGDNFQPPPKPATRQVRLRPIDGDVDNLFVSDEDDTFEGDEDNVPVTLIRTSTDVAHKKHKQLVISTPPRKALLVEKVKEKPFLEKSETKTKTKKKKEVPNNEDLDPPHNEDSDPRHEHDLKPVQILRDDLSFLEALSQPVALPVVRGRVVSTLFADAPLVEVLPPGPLIPADEIVGGGVDFVLHEAAGPQARLTRGGRHHYARFALNNQ